jgi:hypothetical protein
VSDRISFQSVEEGSRDGQWVLELPHSVRVAVETWDLDADVQAYRVAERILEVLG